MKYALRKLDMYKYSVLNLSESKVIYTYRDNVRLRFDKYKKNEYITLYNFVGKEEKVLFVIPIQDLVRVERMYNNITDVMDIYNNKNKLLSISNFFNEVCELNYIIKPPDILRV